MSETTGTPLFGLFGWGTISSFWKFKESFKYNVAVNPVNVTVHIEELHNTNVGANQDSQFDF